ncbi:hypothetical protein Agub_g3836 [Astrephomene gubernaculifera]|uniref:Uncharacterized protein n=1 Tax=Astrephomene gubernaculifera TaxID=47775 RepID=A0AAD3DLG9_9CHLO|nr:hypothetical protein Agub_g3836 [Astrephomene gubernaculifera]
MDGPVQDGAPLEQAIGEAYLAGNNEHAPHVGPHVPDGGVTMGDIVLELYKSICSELAGEVPLLSSLLSVIWMAMEETVGQQLDKLYDEIRNEQREEFALDLKDQFKVLAQEARKYFNMAMNHPQKRDQFNKVDILITLLRSRLVQSDKYEAIRDGLVDYKTLPLLVALGTFELVVRRQELDHYRELFKADIPSEEERQAKIANIRETIKIYSAKCAERVLAVMAWREGFIKLGTSAAGTINLTSTTYSAKDAYDKGWSQHENRQVTPFLLFWTLDSNPDARAKAEAAYHARRSSALTQFSQELWAMMAAARAWQYTDSAVPYNPGGPAYKPSPLYGTQVHGSTPFEDAPSGRPITSIEVGTHEGRVGSLELSYLFAPAGAHGWDYVRDSDAKRETSRLVLAEGEVVRKVRVRVRAACKVQELVFVTSSGREFRGGGGGGEGLRADEEVGESGGEGCELAGVEGYAGERCLTGIRFLWRTQAEG